MINEEEVSQLINQAERHLRSARGEISEAGRTLNAIRRAF
jgi:HEPN domain-containing protein